MSVQVMKCEAGTHEMWIEIANCPYCAIDEVLAAWNKFPAGRRPLSVIATWMMNDMGPAIESARELRERVLRGHSVSS